MEANILAIFLELTKAFDSCELEISQDNLCELVVLQIYFSETGPLNYTLFCDLPNV